MRIKKFQDGGAAPAAAPEAQAAPMQGGEQEAAMQQIAQMAAQIIQQMGPEAAALLAQAIMELLQSSQGAEAQPVFRKGGKLKKGCKKACGGLKVK